MPQTLVLALYRHNTSHQQRGFEAYNWGLLVSPAQSQGRDATAFAASNSLLIDPATGKPSDRDGEWYLETKLQVSALSGGRLLGQLAIGEIPDSVTVEELHRVLGGVRLPAKGAQQASVTWVADAVKSLQGRGWAKNFNVEQLKADALAYADDRSSRAPAQPSFKYYAVRA